MSSSQASVEDIEEQQLLHNGETVQTVVKVDSTAKVDCSIAEC